MKCLNKVLLIGFLGGDPEYIKKESGTEIATFNVACNESYKNDKGELVEKVEWIKCVAWNKLAEICQKYLKKGSKVHIEGKIKTDTYEKDGEKKYSTKIHVSELIMLDSKPSSNTETVSAEKDENLPF